MGTSDVKHLLHNPFCETEQVNNQMLEYINSSIVKCEVEDVNDYVEENLAVMDVNPYYSADDLQNSIGLEKMEGNFVSSSSLKFSTSKARGINRISIKTPDNSDIKDILDSFCEPKDPANDLTSIIKSEPIDDNETIEDTIFDVNYFADNSQITSNSQNNIVKVKNSISKYGSQSTTNSHNVVEVIDDSVTPLLIKKSTSKCEGINKITLKNTNNVKQPMYSKLKHLGTNQINIKVQTPDTKFEPENVYDSIEKPIVKKEIKPCYSTDSLNCTSNIHNLVKDEIRLSPSLLKNSTTKHRANDKKSIKAVENCGVQYIAHNFHGEPKKLGNERISMKLTTPVIKREPEDFNDTSKENIEKVINPSYSSGLKSIVVSHNLVKIDQTVLPSISIKSEDIDSQTDKKKISWEEFRAKREKMGLINISGNICIY